MSRLPRNFLNLVKEYEHLHSLDPKLRDPDVVDRIDSLSDQISKLLDREQRCSLPREKSVHRVIPTDSPSKERNADLRSHW